MSETSSSVDDAQEFMVRVVDRFGNLATSENRDVSVRVTYQNAVVPNTLTGTSQVDIQSGVGRFQFQATAAPATAVLSLQDTLNTGLVLGPNATLSLVSGVL